MIRKTLLEVSDLRTRFRTDGGVVKAVDGISYDVREGETLALVGESGCGKSLSALSVPRLIPDPPGRIVEKATDRDRCREERPELVPVAENHEVACWTDDPAEH